MNFAGKLIFYLLVVTYLGRRPLLVETLLHNEEVFEEIAELRNNVFSIGLLYSVKSSSLISCIVQCMEESLCHIPGWNSQRKICRLHFTEVKLDANSTSENGWRYYGKSLQSCKDCPTTLGYSCGGTNICHKYYDTTLQWLLSRQVCLDDGGYLIKIDCQQKQGLVESLLQNPNMRDIWIQAFNPDTVWTYDDGSPITYSNWNVDEGKNPPSGRTFYGLIRRGQGYKWHDSDGNLTNIAILCEIPT